MLLLEKQYQIPGIADKKAYLVDKKMPAEKLVSIMQKAKAEREAGTQVNVVVMKKNKKFQKEQMEAEGYQVFEEFYADSYEG